MLEKTFDPARIEARIAARWEEAGCFRAMAPGRENAEPFCIVIPPPNVTGSLHIGHALNNTLQDILCRYERMRGKDVLWQPGTDHAGIATQMMVERRLRDTQQPNRRALGREKFLERVWAWKEESGGAIVRQLKRLGASCDWSRERFTMDEGLSQAVLKVFVDLHKQGLIYKDRRLVNWDPQLLTAISDLEVEPREVKGSLWYFDYPLADDPSVVVTVATTRPETMLGDAAVAVHPEDERWKPFIGRMIRLPLVGRLIPIVADEYSDPEKGSGAVKITPAHDFNDFEVGRRHDLPLVNVFTADARLTVRDNADFTIGVPDGRIPDEVLALDGLDRFAARKAVVAWFESHGLLRKIEANAHVVPHGDRSGVVVEPWLTEQWYVNVAPLAEKAVAAVREGRTRFTPVEREKIYFNWLENIEPWCVSRQLWWGHQIPAWYGPDGDHFVELTEAEAQAAADRRYGRPVKLTRDPDVLDTWFSSALWPYSTLGWPERTPELAKFYPNSVLVTGFDIIFFWVARMMMTGIHFMGEAPFRDVLIHGLVRDEKGKKMSKTTGNVIDPLTVIDQYGADALRFTLAAMTAAGRDVRLSMSRVEGYRNFATKLWNAARFAEMNECARVEGFDPRALELPVNRWLFSEAAKAVGEIEAALAAFRFNDACAAAYRFVWGVFCDWYLELAKPLLQGGEGPARGETRASVAGALDVVCAMLHPFMPFVTEELWEATGAAGPRRATMLAVAPWPNLAELSDPEAEAEIGLLVDLIAEIRSVRQEINVPGGAQIPLVLSQASEAQRRVVESWRPMILRLARLSGVIFAEAPPPRSAQAPLRGLVAALPLEGVVDLAAERARLTKEIGKLEGEIAKADAKLANADFLARAREEVVEEQRERRGEAAARVEKLRAALARFARD